MSRDLNYSSHDVKQTDLQIFTEKTKELFIYLSTKIKTYVFPNIIKLLYKLNILKDIEEDLNNGDDKHTESEYSLKVVNACNHSKQIALLDMAVFTSPSFQDCIISQKTLKETVIEFQVVKNKLFIENRSPKGNFLYEGALLEQIRKNLEDMTPVLKKVYIDFLEEEVYQYHCNSFLDISFEDLYEEKWLAKIIEKLSDSTENDTDCEYPREVLNKFKFIYMLIKIQEIKYESITKTSRK